MKLQIALLLGSFLSSLAMSSSALAIDCQNPQTQTDMNQCAYTDLDLATKKINKTYNDLRAKLNPTQKQQLKKVQLAWIKFKDLACKFEASGSEGGSIYSTILSGCLIEKTQNRNKELETLGNCQEGDPGCLVW